MREACGRTNVGKVRRDNEDAYFVDQEAGIYLLADGMGGARGGEHASQLAVETVAQELRSAPSLDAKALRAAIEHANLRILTESRGNPHLEGMGTTLVAALDLGESFLIASVGDSRAYLWKGGELELLTEDQTWVQEVGRPLGLDEETLKRHPMRHVLTMALGVSETVDIRDYRVQANAGSILLLCCDGLHGVVPRAKLEQILGENRRGTATLDEKCSQLIEAARDVGGPDNITAILVAVS